jgi:hypothetical protein
VTDPCFPLVLARMWHGQNGRGRAPEGSRAACRGPGVGEHLRSPATALNRRFAVDDRSRSLRQADLLRCQLKCSARAMTIPRISREAQVWNVTRGALEAGGKRRCRRSQGGSPELRRAYAVEC